MPYDLTEEQRDRYRATSIRSQQRKRALLEEGKTVRPPAHQLSGRLDPNDLMPQLEQNGLTCLSLFSGGGGLDLGFERAGFAHAASYELLDVCGETLNANRPDWDVRSGTDAGDVMKAAFSPFRGVDIVHGG
ncbi:DNA cytosine methyltransferase, partial [Parapusillimonas sp. SGNA-6]|nr:DNA cytosine methyltransferase [Parapusillimonas sp. SGNA-6]